MWSSGTLIAYLAGSTDTLGIGGWLFVTGGKGGWVFVTGGWTTTKSQLYVQGNDNQ